MRVPLHGPLEARNPCKYREKRRSARKCGLKGRGAVDAGVEVFRHVPRETQPPAGAQQANRYRRHRPSDYVGAGRSPQSYPQGYPQRYPPPLNAGSKQQSAAAPAADSPESSIRNGPVCCTLTGPDGTMVKVKIPFMQPRGEWINGLVFCC